ncbi:hypothetical protein CSX04_00287 [Burkholderia cepacia]|nr:hypothetical protein CSX04_00287 [Burkholderia cepacia]
MSALAAPVRRALDMRAVGLMLLLCAIWGFQQVAIKSTNAAIAPMFQAGLRSVIAAALLWGWARSRGTPLFQADGTFGAGLAAGALFAGEFICVFFGLTLTSASHMAIFLYTAPCFTALGLHLFAPGERLQRTQWAGVGLAFAGIALAFADGFLKPRAPGASVLAGLAGDALGILGGAMWAATTVVVRSTASHGRARARRCSTSSRYRRSCWSRWPHCSARCRSRTSRRSRSRASRTSR